MVDVHVVNSLNPNGTTIKFNISLRHVVVKGDDDGDNKWLLEVGSTTSGIEGSKKVYTINSDNFDDVLESAISTLCSKVDWGTLASDSIAPIISSVFPVGSDVPISSSILISLEDVLPSAGIDLSDMVVTLNNGIVDFDITDELEISGDPYKYSLRWSPPPIG